MKNLQSKPLALLTLSTLIMSASPLAYAQFNQFKSKTKFNPNSPNSVIPGGLDSAPTDTFKPVGGMDTTSFSDDEEDFEGEDDEFGGEGGEQTAFSDSEPSTDSFGRKSMAPKNKNKDAKKYVNLNPETAFGPEVVTSFDFPNVSILDLTKHMQKLTGLNLILDKDIKGKISISTPSPITIGDAWKAYLQALSINGYSLVKNGAYYTIVQNRDIRYSPTTMYTGSYSPNTENFVMQIIPLKYISSKEVSNAFRPFMSRYGRILEIKQTNTLIVQETGTHINRLMKLIKFIDIPGHEESLQIIKVKNTSAQELATLLDKILKGNQNDNKFKTSASTGQTSQISISRLIAEPRTNTIIAMANADGARELKGLIEKLDVKVVAAGSGQVHVYYLNHGDAEALSKTLSSLVTNAPKAQQSSGGAASNLGGLTRFTSGNSNTATAATLFNNDVKITADKDNNALIVNASPTDYETVKAVIAKLDIPRDQVYVEGLMMETQAGTNNGFGTTVVGAYGSGGTQRAGYGDIGSMMGLISGNFTSLSGFFAGGGVGTGITMKGANGAETKINSVNGLITALAANAKTNILATPQILTLDNVEGIFESGEKVPTLETSTTNGTVQTSTKQQDVKLSLKITPQINKATRFIKLKIDQKIQDFSSRALPKNLQDNGVGVTERAINTTVIVRNRDTIAMGGLMRDKELNKVDKVPLLGDIPVLGWLFKNSSKTVEKVNLLFFLTPRILANYEKSNAENVKDLLNRRQAHLKNASVDDEAFASTVKGIYDKAKKQQEGPLFDVNEIQKFRDKNQESNSFSGGPLTGSSTNNKNDSSLDVNPVEAVDNNLESPDYQSIINDVNQRNEIIE